MKISLIRPLDQPPATRRLLNDLKAALCDRKFDNFRTIVAYAKSGPLLRLRELLISWRKLGKSAEIIVGIDQRGTSREALELALALFDKVYVTQEPQITFHPKIYLFDGRSAARALIGSNNLTVGGTEKNFESAVDIEMSLPAEQATFDLVDRAWSDLLPGVCKATKLLDITGLARLERNGDVLDERTLSRKYMGSDRSNVARGRKAASGIVVKPESPLPKAMPAKTKVAKAKAGGAAKSVPSSMPVRGFAIQIKPHHNGEIFLSVSAALQNQNFFLWPFTGKTTPKKAGNPSYPQLSPDPQVNVIVWGSKPLPLLTLAGYSLNTVYYAKKSEIRITASPLVGIVPDYSVMIMEHSATAGITYDITIHRPDSPDYAAWIAACNQTMPGGGRAPRKYGWF